MISPPFLDRGGDRLFHHDVDTAGDAGERDIAMQMRRRRDGDCVDTEIEQLLDVGDGRATERAGDEIGLLAVGIGDGDELDAGQAGEDAGVIAAHDADAHHADAQRMLSVRIFRLRHGVKASPGRQRRPKPSLSMRRDGRREFRGIRPNTF